MYSSCGSSTKGVTTRAADTIIMMIGMTKGTLYGLGRWGCVRLNTSNEVITMHCANQSVKPVKFMRSAMFDGMIIRIARMALNMMDGHGVYFSMWM